MGVRLLLELCDHDHELLDYCTVACAVDCRYIPFNAVLIVEVPRGGSMREWKQTLTSLR